MKNKQAQRRRRLLNKTKHRERNCARLVISGGNVNNTTIAGPFYRACNDGAGNTNWNIGGRPLC